MSDTRDIKAIDERLAELTAETVKAVIEATSGLRNDDSDFVFDVYGPNDEGITSRIESVKKSLNDRLSRVYPACFLDDDFADKARLHFAETSAPMPFWCITPVDGVENLSYGLPYATSVAFHQQ